MMVESLVLIGSLVGEMWKALCSSGLSSQTQNFCMYVVYLFLGLKSVVSVKNM